MDWISLIGFTVATFAAAVTGGIFPPGAWYETLAKPSWTPPNWLFPLAWTVLYVAMIAAAYRVAQAGATAPLALWSAQMVLNALWTPVFFGLRNIRGGLAAVAALWLAVLATMTAFFQVDWIAGALFVPYLAWVTTATALNAAVLRLNPAAAKASA